MHVPYALDASQCTGKITEEIRGSDAAALVRVMDIAVSRALLAWLPMGVI